MKAFITQQYEQAMERFPDYIKDIFRMHMWERKVVSIGRAHNIHVDVIEIFINEMKLLLAGLITHTDFMETMLDVTSLDRTTIEAVIAEVNIKVLAPIQEDIRIKVEQAEALLHEQEMAEELALHGIEIGHMDAKAPTVQSAPSPAPVAPMQTPPPAPQPFAFVQKGQDVPVQTSTPPPPFRSIDPYREPIA